MKPKRMGYFFQWRPKRIKKEAAQGVGMYEDILNSLKENA